MESSKHRARDRTKSDKEQLKDAWKEGRERKKEDRDEREKDKSMKKDYDRDKEREKTKEAGTRKQSEAASEIRAWVNRSRKLEKERALQLSKNFQEQDNNIAVKGSDDDVAQVKVEVLTIKDQPILADGDVNEDVDMLENVEIGEQKRRDEAYKAAKKKTGVYDDPELTGVSTNTFQDLNSSGKVSSDYYTCEEMLQFKKHKKKKSLRKKDKLDMNALEAEAISSGLGVGDLGSRKDAIKDEHERLEAETRNNAYQSAYAKADEASKLLRLEQTLNVETEEDETPVFVDDDDEDFLRKSLEKARRLVLIKKQEEEEGASDPQAIALLATSNHNNDIDDQNHTTAESTENKVVFTEMQEFVWGHVFMHDEEKTNEAGGWTQVKETNSKDEQPSSEDNKEIVPPDETIHEVAVGKGWSGTLKLLKERGTLKESIEWGDNKKKSKLVGVVDDGEKEISIERTDEFGRILTPKEAFRMISHKFHGKGPGKRKQEKRMKQYQQELKMKQMKSSDTPSLSVERMREAQTRFKTPYLVLSGHVKPGQMIGDPKLEHLLGIKRKAKPSSSDNPKKPRS